MQGYTKIQEEDTSAIPRVSTSQDLAKYHTNYFIFADKVYDINKVITSHPGGY